MRSLFTLVSGAATAHRSAGVVLRAVENRARLVALELDDERARLARMLGTALAIAVLFLAVVLAGTLLVAAMAWDTPHRVAVLACLLVVELLGAGALILWVRRQWATWQPLADTRRELQRDLACVRELFNADDGREEPSSAASS